MEKFLYFITFPNSEEAVKLVRILLEKKIIACANIIPKIKSLYWWKGKIEEDEEVYVILKTVFKNSSDLLNEVKKHHPYEVPECIGIKIESGLPEYLNWISESTKI